MGKQGSLGTLGPLQAPSEANTNNASIRAAFSFRTQKLDGDTVQVDVSQKHRVELDASVSGSLRALLFEAPMKDSKASRTFDLSKPDQAAAFEQLMKPDFAVKMATLLAQHPNRSLSDAMFLALSGR